MPKIKPLARQKDIVIQEFGNEILIYDLIANKAFNLNETSALIWQKSDGHKTISEIAEDLSGKFNSNISEEFVWLALEQLQKGKLIEIEPEIEGIFQKSSRREIIRQVGLTTLVTLPLVSSLLVPSSIMASSLSCSTAPFSNGCACTAAAQCSSNCCGSLGGSFACTAPGLDPAGSPCRANCECAPGLTCPVASPRVCA